MSQLDQQTDAQLSALAALLRGALQYEHGESMVKTVYDHPRTWGEMGDQGLPGMSVYVVQSDVEHQYSGLFKQKLRILVDYFLPATSLDYRESRYPALRAVWTTVVGVVVAGFHAAVQDGAGVLCAAGLDVEEERPGGARFGVIGDGRNFPFFRGELRFDHLPNEVDPATLSDFLRLYTAWDVPGGDHVLGSHTPPASPSDPDVDPPPSGWDQIVLPAYSGS